MILDSRRHWTGDTVCGHHVRDVESTIPFYPALTGVSVFYAHRMGFYV